MDAGRYAVRTQFPQTPWCRTHRYSRGSNPLSQPHLFLTQQRDLDASLIFMRGQINLQLLDPGLEVLLDILIDQVLLEDVLKSR